MEDAIKYFQTTYQTIWNSIPWKPLPYEQNTLFCSQDAIIRNVLVELNQADPATPLPAAFETAKTDLHYTIVSYENEFVLYWLSYYILEGDKGYVLYRFTKFVDSPFNFQDLGKRFKLPQESTAKIYMDTFTRLNEWANLLQLPYKYEVDLKDNFMGFRKNYDKPVTIPEVSEAAPDDTTSQKNAPVVSRPTFWNRLLARLKQ